MSSAYATPLELELSPSQRQTYVLIFIHLLAVLSILLLPWPIILRWLLVLAVLAVSVWLSRKKKLYDLIVWQAGNHWLLKSKNSSTTAELLTESFMTSWLIILLFKVENHGRCAVLIWPDSVRPDVFRRLRVRLKLEAGKLITVT